MKKFIKKVSYLLFILSILFVSSSNIYALDSITVTNKDEFSAAYSTYLQAFGLGHARIIKADGNYVYCIENSLGVPDVGKNLLKSSAIDLGSGYAYILNNGFPNKSVSGLNDAEIDYAITQLAIYYYQQQKRDQLGILTEGASTIGVYESKLNGTNLDNIAEKLKTMQSSSDTTAQSFANMVIGLAQPAINGEYSEITKLSLIIDSSELTLSSDGKYYVSKGIMLKQNLSYRVKTNVDGAIIKDTYGNIKTNFAADDEFIIMIPVDEYVSSFTVTVEADVVDYSAYYINSDSEGYQTQKLVAQDTKELQVTETFTVVKSTTTEPETPEEPEEPEEPETPEEPEEPEEPETPTDSEEPAIPEESTTTETPEEVEVPKTAANIPLYVWAIGFVCIVAGAKLVYSRAK